MEMIRHGEALNRQAALDDANPAWPRRGFSGLVVSDQAAYRNSTVRVHALKNGPLCRATGVFKEKINAIWCGLGQLLNKIGVVVINRMIKAQLFGKPLAFFLRACDTNHR